MATKWSAGALVCRDPSLPMRRAVVVLDTCTFDSLSNWKRLMQVRVDFLYSGGRHPLLFSYIRHLPVFNVPQHSTEYCSFFALCYKTV